jgi:methionyl-tRNA formyltransferase
MKFAVLGRTKWLYDAAELAVANGHELVYVATCQESPEYINDKFCFENLARKHRCKFFRGSNLNKKATIKEMIESKADIAISLNWLTIVGGNARNVFKHGIVNVHAGDLPRYRGNAVVNWAIINGEENVVLTAHKMVEELDAGEIYLQHKIPITKHTNVGNVFDEFGSLIPQMFLEVINKASENCLIGVEQSSKKDDILRCFARLPQDSLINWSDSSESIDRLIRASSAPFHGAFTYFCGAKLVIWKADTCELPYKVCGIPGHVAIVNNEEKHVIVLCGTGAIKIFQISYKDQNNVEPTTVLSSVRFRLSNL